MTCAGATFDTSLRYYLVWRAARWEVRIGADENKNNRRRDFDLPGWAHPIVDDYVDIAPPALGGTATEALWLSTQHKRCPAGTLTAIVVRCMRDWFGVARASHWFRKCLTTTAASASNGTSA